MGLNGATSMTLTASTFLGTGSGAPLILDSVLGNGNLLVTLAAGGNAFIDVTDTGVTDLFID